MQEYTVFKKFTAQDYATVPFNANKQYDFIGSASVDTNGVKYFHSSWTSESVSLYSSASSAYGGDTKNLIKYYQIDHLFYKGRGPFEHQRRNIGNSFGNFHYENQRRILYDKLNIVSIPAGHYGHSIKKGSFYLSASLSPIFNSTKYFGEHAILVDDSKGNLIISGTKVENYNTDTSENILNIGPIKGFRRHDLSVYSGYINVNSYQEMPYWRRGKSKPNASPNDTYSTPDFGDEFDDSYYFNVIKYKKVKFKELELFPKTTSSVVEFNGSTSEIKMGNNEKFDFNKGDNFTITLWAQVVSHSAVTALNTPQYLISKSTTKTVSIPQTSQTANPIKLNVTGAFQPTDIDAGPRHPFEVYVQNDLKGAGKPCVFFSRADESSTLLVSASFNTGSNMQHITCQYSSSIMKVYINGLESGTSTTDNLSEITENNANLYIGNKGGSNNYLSGSLSQINIFNTLLTDTQIKNHYSSSNGSPYVGNIFYSHGLATITHPKLNLAMSGSNIERIKYQGNHLIYENEYQCTVEEHEFNDTLNISARKRKKQGDSTLAPFTTSSFFKPYVTTIGLYDEHQNLLVVGKLGQPIRMSDETDTTFIMRWDT